MVKPPYHSPSHSRAIILPVHANKNSMFLLCVCSYMIAYSKAMTSKLTKLLSLTKICLRDNLHH